MSRTDQSPSPPVDAFCAAVKASTSCGGEEHPCIEVVRCAAALLTGDQPASDEAVITAVRRLIDRVSDPSDRAIDTLERVAMLYAESLDLSGDVSGFTRRRRQGAYFTPPAIVSHLLDHALDPMLRHSDISSSESSDRPMAEARPSDPLQITICDPACGTGAFLLEAARRLARALHAVRGGTMTSCLQDVTRHCMHGMDIDPVATAIAGIVLSAQAGLSGESPESVCPGIRTGNALLGASFEDARRGVPDQVFQFRPGDDRAALRELRLRNRRERAQISSSDVCGQGFRYPDAGSDAWVMAFLRGPVTDAHDPNVITSRTIFEVAGEEGASDARRRVQAAARGAGVVHWNCGCGSDETAGGRTIVVGNPPFLSPLFRETAASRGIAALLHAQSDGAIHRYVDLATAFLFFAARRVRPDDRIALVMPSSMMAGRDSRKVREEVLARCRLRHLWLADGRAFGCAVRPCAVVLERAAAPSSAAAELVGRSIGHAPVQTLSPVAVPEEDYEPIASIAASLVDVPMVSLRRRGTIGSQAVVTADFRDQYYGLRGFIVEDAEVARSSVGFFPRLATTGVIDLAVCRWGERSVRILGRAWHAPRIDRERMRREGPLGAWIDDRSVAKILLATQTRVIEVFVDESGDYVPSVPLISVVPHPDADPWMLAAALAAPPVTAHALRLTFGASMDARSIRLAAGQVADLPLPADRAAWREAAALFRRASTAAGERERADALLEGALPGAMSFGMSARPARELVRWWEVRLRGQFGRRKHGAREAGTIADGHSAITARTGSIGTDV